MVAVSARMIAQLAVADGYEVTALDRFGDVDLRAIAAAATAPGNDALVALAVDIDADAVVYGGGLENRPGPEQQRGRFDQLYVERVAQVVGWAKAVGM